MLRVCKTLQRSEPQDSIVFLILGELLILDLCRPKHPQYKRLKPTPSLFANGLLFLLAIIISAGAFKDYKTRSDPCIALGKPHLWGTRRLREVVQRAWSSWQRWGWHGLVFALCFRYVGNHTLYERRCPGYTAMKLANTGVQVLVQLLMADAVMAEGLNYIISRMVWYMKLPEFILEGS